MPAPGYRREPGRQPGFDAGYTLAEALIALIMLTVLLHAAWSVTARHTRGAAELVRRSEVLETVRIAGWALREELKVSRAGTDWLAHEDSLSLRAFRGLAVPCAGTSAPGVFVAEWDGVRQPDVAKDSLLLLMPDGVWRPFGLARVSRVPSCRPTGIALRFELEDPEAGGYVGRLFERGSYHVADGALRYRRGMGGRQPLTPRVLASESGLQAMEPAGAAMDLRPSAPEAPSDAWAAIVRLWGHLPP